MKQVTLFDLVSREAEPLPQRAPFVRGSDTSEAAADSITPHGGRLRQMVFAVIVAAGDAGRTDDEIEVQTGLPHQTASARRRELVLAGRISDTGLRRTTRSGRKAAVWKVAS